MAVNKIKRTKAIGALRKAGVSHENAVRILRHGYLDPEEAFGPQIEDLREDFPHYFEPATDDAPAGKGDDPKPQTTMERKIARLRGEGNPLVHKHERPERKSTASAAAQEIAAHITPKGPGNKPPSQQWREPVRDINGGHAPLTREPNASAQQLAARLKGN
ncbi:hypothetical protein [Streptomyces parvus]|uniref:hypothetical protein n=1 Tax=Streptomyces parvus TaxID=66428 RepID=UPI0033F8BD5C